MTRLVYGTVAAAALVLATGGLSVACEQHAKSAAVQTPAAATQATYQGSWIVAQQDGDKSGSEESKEKSEDSK